MAESIRVDPARAALLVVDMQPDFMPGGALPVAGGDELIAPLAALMSGGPFRLVVATQDWHPRGHVSFASSHPGRSPFEVIDLYGHPQTLWPEHCVQGTPGAALHGDLPWERAAAIVRKGMEPDTDSYSGFRNNWTPAGARPPTGLAGYLRERGVRAVFCCGLARDVCVQWTAADAAAAGFESFILWDLTRAVDPEADARVRAALESAGVQVLTTDRLG